MEEHGIESNGDVAVCTLRTAPDRVAPDLKSSRVASTTPLRSRSDLDSLLRTLARRPNLRHLVVCGDDPRAAGESVVALWERGLDSEGRLPDSRGKLCETIDRETVDAVRGSVQLWDWRDKTSPDVARGIDDLPSPAGERPAHDVPDPTVPKRKTFLSRKTSFPIFSTGVGDGWLQLLNLVLRIGTDKTASDARRAEALNAVVTVTPPDEPAEFPSYLDFNADDFEAYYQPFGSSRLERVCEDLEAAADTHSTPATLLDPSETSAAEGIPSLLSPTFDVVEGKLFGSFVMRKVDVYTDWPFEARALIRLQRAVALRLGHEFGAATFVIHSAYLLEEDWARALRLLSESFKRPLPLQVDPSGVFLFGNDGGKARAMLLDHDASTIFWEEAFSNPEDLSWYIVDVMPWLLPQHIRYVGQECASLMRAMRERECYLQG